MHKTYDVIKIHLQGNIASTIFFNLHVRNIRVGFSLDVKNFKNMDIVGKFCMDIDPCLSQFYIIV